MLRDVATAGEDIAGILLGCAQEAQRERRTSLASDSVLAHMTKGTSFPASGELRRVMLDIHVGLSGTRVSDGPVLTDQPERTTHPSADSDIDMVLTEISWRSRQRGHRRPDPSGYSPARGVWHDSVRDALTTALSEARSAGVTHAGAIHLLVGLLADAASPASALLTRTRIDRMELLARLRSDPAWAAEAAPFAPLVSKLELAGGVAKHAAWPLRLISGLMHRSASRHSRYRSPVTHVLEGEIVRQAVRLNSPAALTAHGILAIASLAHQLSMTGLHLRERHAPYNRAIDVLTTNGLTVDETLSAARGLPMDESPSTPEETSDLWATGTTWSRRASTSLNKAIALADRLGHPEVGSSHILISLLEDEENTAVKLIEAAGHDPISIRKQTQQTLTKPK